MFKQIGLAALLVASANAACWSLSQGSPCCSSSDATVYFEDADGKWGIENGDWCGIPEPEPIVQEPPKQESCWSLSLGSPCCSDANAKVYYEDNDGKWGIENGEWCGIPVAAPVQKCWAEAVGYPCCKTTTKVEFVDDDGKWGLENGDWCGIVAGATSVAKTTTTTRKTTTTTKKASRATYAVIYEAGSKLNNGYDNWGWDSSLSFKDASMVIKADPETYGAASIKNLKGTFTGGSIRFDVKSKGKVFIKVENTDTEDLTLLGTTYANTDFETYKFDVDEGFEFDRINIQDGSGNGDPIYIRYLIYSSGSAEDFVDPIDTSYIPVTTTRKPVVNAVYTTIFRDAYGMPNGYENWGWGCSISYSGGAMIIFPDEGEYGAVSLKRTSGTFKSGSLRFDMKNEGKVNVMVESTDRDEKANVAVISPSSTYQTYIVDVNFDGTFDRINFQDAKGTGDRIWVKNLVHSTGYADDFNDPI